ncbi:MAG: NHLP bacteriocin export ABC transporter permease/ATPase subunit [Selenomonas sp.]|uniref:NHLP bacteriocin export ABC transporter permease/ATPase subunit n=1 Tax=Selenomonas sp. AE3005 TaxID=1485543 RepID=UPI00056AF1E2|nr:NHLP bacteriocin export ABC transporter permease/ATPase subunit [Selenomonas sp. AE3005]MBQ1614930.1 NHLP bacteriocin export ABC transporter permease/ATPase subunit [Selenomonas sp.]MBQ2087143.1 NHLP bacteriocin export ABC transporter permease/ATPase subunit [Selenomonas sp.]
MEQKGILSAGQRLLLKSDAVLLQVTKGSAEVYGVTRKKDGTEDALSFRRCYLMDIGPGEAAFPAIDEFKEIRVQIYALEEMEYTLCPLENVETEALRAHMTRWFSRLVELPWLRLMADKGDDMLQEWKKGRVFRKLDSKEELLAEFAEHEEVLSMFMGMRFGAEDKRLSRRILLREKARKLLVENGIRSLLGEEMLFVGEADNPSTGRQVEDASFIVQQVAKALKMPTDTISISEETARDLDYVALLRRLMQKGNMQMRLVTLPENWYKKDTGVMIGFYTPPGAAEKEMAAFIPETPERYRIVLRQRPEGILLTDAEAGRIGKDAFQCYAGFPSRALKLWDLIKFMFWQCWTADYRTIILCSMFGGLIPLATPIITETIFQDIIPILDRQGLATVTQALMVTSFTTAALGIVRAIAVMRIGTRIEIAAEAAMWGRLTQLPTKFFRKYTVGELASRMGGIGIAKSIASGEFVGSILSFIFSFWSIFLMCYYSIKLTAAAIVVWIVYALFVAVVLRRVLFFQRKIIAAGNKTAGTVQQIFAGLAKFRVQGAEEQAYSLWTRTFGEHWNWSLKLRWQNNYTSIISSMQPFILTLILYWIAVYGMNELGPDGKTVQKGIGYAQFIAFNAAYSSFNGVMGGIIGLISQYFGIQPQLENLRPILEAVPESAGDKQDAGKLSGALEVSHLTFSYTNMVPDEKGNVTEVEGDEVLHDVSFSVAAGENVAIVGKSGSGKSTLVRLLLGFEVPKSGAVYFDGHDLSDVNLPSVRSQMGVVLQNGQLMTGDIYTNIVGTKLLTQDDAWQAAEAAGIAEDIAEMPMGMQTVISEGSSNISGGQRQRILIARALVGKPSILIFDEATSALDNRSQSIVTKSLDRLHATRIIVAHRLSTIRNCDRIIVMDEGRVAEMGTFNELVEKGGIFSELVKRQVA